MSFHACVWIDHHEAKVFGLTKGTSVETHFADHSQHLHKKADRSGHTAHEVDHAILDAVATALHGAEGILITGPGQAKSVLAGWLIEHHPAIAKKVWDIKPADHPTDAELVAEARAYFRAADRMHA
jgi:stalled ribosome rescue protein Dom34